MPAPITSVLTSYTGADENPLSEGGAWTNSVVSGEGTLKRLSNQLAWASGARGSAWWNVTSFGANQEAFITVPTVASNIGLYLRLASPGGAANGYMAWYSVGNGYRIWKLVAGAYGALVGYTATPTLVAGDKLAFSAIGTTLVFSRFNGTSWTDIITLTDSTYAAGGFIGILGDSDTTWRIDDFGGGTVSTNIDAATIIGTSSLISSELRGSLETSTIIGVSKASIVDSQAVVYSDAATISGVSSVSSTELQAHGYVDSATITSNSILSTSDLYGHSDDATVSSVSSVRIVEVVTQVQDFSVNLAGSAYVSGTLTAYIVIGTVEVVQGGGGTVEGEPPTDPVVVAGSAGGGDTDSGVILGLPSNAV